MSRQSVSAPDCYAKLCNKVVFLKSSRSACLVCLGDDSGPKRSLELNGSFGSWELEMVKEVWLCVVLTEEGSEDEYGN